MSEPPKTSYPLLSPKLDVVFKCLFVSEPSLLMALLNSILPEDGYAEVAELQICNPDIDRATLTSKQIVLDIRALDALGRQFNVELQIQSHAAYIPRAIFYLSRLHAMQLSIGETYQQINPTLGIHLLDFTLQAQSSAWRHCFEWRERTQPAWRLTDQQALWLIELPKAASAITTDSATTPLTTGSLTLDGWAQFFNNPEIIMTTVTPVPAPIQRAVEKLQELSADERTRQLAQDRQRALIDWQLERNALLAEGREKGKVEGKAEGKAEAQQDFARILLKEGFSVEKTAALTGLPASEVEALI